MISNKICHCALPAMTGSTECCENCPNSIYANANFTIDKYTDTLKTIGPLTNVSVIQEFNRWDILNLKRQLLQDLVDNVIEITPSMILRISNIFDDFVK